MFEMLTDRLNGVFKKLRNRGRLRESNIDDAMREVRRALLEADVNYKVARSFIARVKERALGRAVIKSITPGQQVVKIVHDELIALMGERNAGLQFAETPPSAVMMVGLQVSRMTTSRFSRRARSIPRSAISTGSVPCGDRCTGTPICSPSTQS